MPEVFNQLGSIQLWCSTRNVFELSALIVTREDARPGRGYYGRHVANRDEWMAYVRLALGARGAGRAVRPSPEAVAHAGPEREFHEAVLESCRRSAEECGYTSESFLELPFLRSGSTCWQFL